MVVFLGEKIHFFPISYKPFNEFVAVKLSSVSSAFLTPGDQFISLWEDVWPFISLNRTMHGCASSGRVGHFG